MVGPAAFPVAKLGFLLVRQVSKPLAKSVAARAKKSPFFRDWVCVPVAQLFHFYEIKMKMRALNLGTGKVTKVPKLTEAKAVEQGSEILSEFVIISIASSILIYEYNRQTEKDEVKQEKLKADRESIKNKIFELELKVEKQSTQIRNLAKTAIHLEEEIHKKSLKRLFGKSADVPQELIKTVEEIPEIPNEIKPLVLLEDKIEEEVDELSKSRKGEESSNVPDDTMPTIKEIVEKHYAQPMPIENKGDILASDSTYSEVENKGDIPASDSTNSEVSDVLVTDSKPVNKQGLVADSLANDQVKSELQTSTKDGIVTEALAYYFKGAKN
eukprot:GFUD01121443.1.p1 GENE.GFUD01121443.1~~GFUD01121443.1.p1  ORF type:complete len:327 (-),score=106.22 GFUD01121443.1:12-992(-)